MARKRQPVPGDLIVKWLARSADHPREAFIGLVIEVCDDTDQIFIHWDDPACSPWDYNFKEGYQANTIIFCVLQYDIYRDGKKI